MMEKTPIIKARAHHGSKSLDISIPVKICDLYKIKDGDAFSVEVSQNDDIEIVYRRIFKQ